MSFSDVSGETNAKQQRIIEEAQKLSFRSTDWKIQETDYFIIFSHDKVSNLKEKLEKNLNRFCLQAAKRIGYKDFRLYETGINDWDKKFKFFIYGTQESWQQAKKKFGVKEWAIAWASGNRTIFFYYLDVDEKIILHEVAHEIYREYIAGQTIPLWWCEGIARFSELPKLEIREKIVNARFRIVNKTHIPLSQLTSYDIREPDLIYDEGLSAVVFLRVKYGASCFDKLNKAMHDGKSFEFALADSYGDGFTTVNELNRTWENSLRDKKIWDVILNNLLTVLKE